MKRERPADEAMGDGRQWVTHGRGWEIEVSRGVMRRVGWQAAWGGREQGGQPHSKARSRAPILSPPTPMCRRAKGGSLLSPFPACAPI